MEISVLIEKAQAGDASARKILIEENLGLVHHIVKRFAGRGYEVEDLFQTGTIGLMKAIDHFDLSYDVKFSTYAVPLIAGEIRRFLRDDGPVKVSRSLKDANYKLRQVIGLVQENADKNIAPEDLQTFYRVLEQLLNNFEEMSEHYDTVFESLRRES